MLECTHAFRRAQLRRPQFFGGRDYAFALRANSNSTPRSMVRTTLPFGSQPYLANHVPTRGTPSRAHCTSCSPRDVAIRAMRAATLLTSILVGVACGGG